MTVKVIIQPGEDGAFVARAPAFRGCWSQGKTREVALHNVRKALLAWLEAEQDKTGRDQPPGDVESLTV